MVIQSRLKTSIFLLLVVFLSVQYNLVYAANLSAAAERAVAGLSEKDIVLKEFKEVYSRIKSNITKGVLVTESGDRADSLTIELKKYLINARARQEILKMDALSGAEEKRLNAVEKLMALSAEEERFKLSQLSQLKSLEQASEDPEKISQKQTKTLDFEIEIKPEDITLGAHD